MKKPSTPSGRPPEIQGLPETDSAALSRVLQTREARQLLAKILPDILNTYAGESVFKKLITRLIGRHLKKSLSRPADVFEKNELQQLVTDERLIEDMAGLLPNMVNNLFGIITGAVTTIDGLETERKKQLFSGLISAAARGQTGALITWGCRILNDIHRDDPEFFAKTMEPGVKNWIESLDFAELKEAMGNSAGDTRVFVEMANNIIWQYPAKVVLLLSLLPTVVNILSDSIHISLNRLNQLPPDLFADVTISFLHEIDGKAIAGVLDELTELVRKLDTGSRLVGEPGSPQLPKAIVSLVDTITAGMDPVVLWKSKIAAAEIKAVIAEAMAEAATRRDDLRKAALERFPEIYNIRIRSFNRRLAYWESADDDEMSAAIAGHLSAYDVQEIGDAITSLLEIFNRVCDRKPDWLSEIAGRLAGAVDEYELAEAGRHLFEKSSGEFKPLARALVPKIVKWVCAVISPDEDEYEEDAAQAREALASLFAIEEG